MRKFILLLTVFVSSLCLYGQDSLISIINDGDEGEFSIYVDGLIVGKNLTEVKNPPAGTYEVEIRQKRFGRETVIKRTSYTVEQGVSAEFRFSIPYLTPEEIAPINALKKAIDDAVEDVDYLTILKFDLMDQLAKFGDLSFNPSLEEEKLVLEDYMLKIEIATEQRKAIADFISKTPLDLSYFLEMRDFHTYKNNSLIGAELYANTLQYVLILKRLESLILLQNRRFRDFRNSHEELKTYLHLSKEVNERFDVKYQNDWKYRDYIFQLLIEKPIIPYYDGFYTLMKEYYGDIWATIDRHRVGKFYIDSRETLALRAAFYNLEQPVEDDRAVFARIQSKRKISKLSMEFAGGSLLSVGFFMQPLEWLAFEAGLSGTFDFLQFDDSINHTMFNSQYAASLPIEVMFYIINRNFDLYVGVSTEVFRFQDQRTDYWSNRWISSLVPDQEQSHFSFFPQASVNLGLSVSEGDLDLYVHNYITINFLELGLSENFPIYYTPALGIRY